MIKKTSNNLVVYGKIRKVRPHPLNSFFQLAEFNNEHQVVIGPWFKEGASGILFCNNVVVPPIMSQTMDITRRLFTYDAHFCIIGNLIIDNIFSEGWFWSNECEVDGKKFVPSWWISAEKKWKEGDELSSKYNLAKPYGGDGFRNYKSIFTISNFKNWVPHEEKVKISFCDEREISIKPLKYQLRSDSRTDQWGLPHHQGAYDDGWHEEIT